MAPPSLIRLSTRIERAAFALCAVERHPATQQLDLLIDDLAATCHHLGQAVERWAGWAEQRGNESACEALCTLTGDLRRAGRAAAAARDALLAAGRAT
jgi:hypothetical protein